MTKLHQRATRGGALFSLVTLWCLSWTDLSGAESATKKFNLPASSAEQSLKDFSRQANVEVVFATHATDGVRTTAVRGEFAPIEALTRLLSGTPLQARRDERTGAIVVSRGRTPDPNGSRAALMKPGDRPQILPQPKPAMVQPIL